jgi:protein required for attachment to host cells
MRLSAETLLVLADGSKAVFFRNQGFNGQVRLKQLQRFGIENLASHEMGWDRAGRAFARLKVRCRRANSLSWSSWHRLGLSAY